MMRYLLTLLALIGVSLVFAQKEIPPRFANEQELTQNLRRLSQEQAAIDLLAPLIQLKDSPSAQSALRLALTTLKAEGVPVLAEALNRIEKHRKINASNKKETLAREAQYLDVGKQITQLQTLQTLLKNNTTENIDVQTELNFYQLRPDMRIAELGAGDPAFAKQLLKNLTPEHYYLNDIDPLAVQMMSDFFHLWSEKTGAVPILGESHSTQLEGQNLDAIIIRNALHHFDELPAMLASIQTSLAPEGKLLLKETFTESCYGLCCPDLRPEAELLQALEKAGFRLHRRSAIYEETATWHLLEFFTPKNPHH